MLLPKISPSSLRISVRRLLPFQTISTFSSAKLAHRIGSPPSNLIEISTGQLIEKITSKYPSNTAVNSFSQNVSMTYQELYAKTVSLATGLVKILKLKPKDRIGIYSYNKWQWHIIQLAAAMADLILVNINPAYQSEQLAYTLQKVELKVLFLSDSFKKSNYLQIVQKIIPELSTSPNPYQIKSERFPNFTAAVRFDSPQNRQSVKGFINFSELFIEGNRQCLPKYPSCHQPTNIQFTSGTTGLPKAATLSHYNILNNGFQIGNRLNYTHKDNIALPVPFYHCFGMVMGSLAALSRGAAISLICEGFDPKKALQTVEKYKCSSLYGVPTMFSEYLRVMQEGKENDYDLSSLKKGIVAGALCPEPLMHKIINKLGIKQMTNCYGMTETSPVSFQTSTSDPMIKMTTTVGCVLDGCEAKIVDQHEKTVNVGQSGEFWTKGWHVMIGYWNDPAATASSIENGWMKSGDMGILDEEGYLSIVGRKKDMIIRGGQNIYPKQIQDYLHKMPNTQFQDIQVIGVKDEKFGEQIAALIKVKSTKQNKITKKQVVQFCKDKIAHFKIPKYIMFVEELPLTVTGKPQKFIMRKQFQKLIQKNQHLNHISH